MLAVFIISLFGFLLLGVPVAFSLLLTAVGMMIKDGQIAFSPLANYLMVGLNSFPLLAVPFFILAGEIMSAGGMSKRILSFASAFTGHIKGGMGHVAALGCQALGGVSGAAVADATAMGSIMLPLMEKAGYHKGKSTALICSAAIASGPLIPPGLPMIFYGIAVGVSIIDLFIAGLLPGIIIAIGTMVIWAFVAKKENYVGEGSFSFKRALIETKNSFLALVFPIIILVGIRFGVFTPTEAGAVAVVYAFIVTGFIYRELKWGELFGILSRTAVGTSVVILIAGMSRVVAHYVTIARIPHILTETLMRIADTPWEFMLILNISLLFVGMVMDITPAILLLGPILAPLGNAYGFDPVHFGLIIIINLVIGLLTPPVGTVLFVGSRLSGLNMLEIAKHLLPYILFMVAVLVAVILLPDVFLFLPRLGR